MLSFACFSPHPPILLPSVGSQEDREKVKNTIESLEKLGNELRKADPDILIISSPHPDWGFNVPLYFLASKIKNQNLKLYPNPQNYQSPNNVLIERSNRFTILPILTTLDSPKQHFKWGKDLYQKLKNLKLKASLIASGDMSHCLKPEGPYGFHPDGPKFDKDLIKCLNEKNIERFLMLDDIYPNSANCGLRSFSFLLGILEQSGIKWQPNILSYEGPFGVGYLVVDFKLRHKIINN